MRQSAASHWLNVGRDRRSDELRGRVLIGWARSKRETDRQTASVYANAEVQTPTKGGNVGKCLQQLIHEQRMSDPAAVGQC